MSKKPLMTLYAAGIFGLTLIILSHPAECLTFALSGLNLWFQKMIPALFPFMVLSGIMIRMNLTDSFVKLLSPVLKPLFCLHSSCIYVIFVGFLCGFPMGAHATAQLYGRGQISRKEAELLLAFCNNIGPVYFISFALPVIGVSAGLWPIIGMYGLPLLYGLILRHTVYAKTISVEKQIITRTNPSIPKRVTTTQLISCESTSQSATPSNFLAALDESVTSALSSIARLGGYMIFFNLLNIIPALYLPKKLAAFGSCILEITGGLQILGQKAPIFALCILPFGGLSCLAQTYSMIKESDLSLGNYLFHKILLTAFSVVYYVVLALTTF